MLGGVMGLALVNAAPPAGMTVIPAGVYVPLLRSVPEKQEMPVAAFLFDERQVTNRQFLDFVTESPRWRRSQVSGLFADSSYLESWDNDLSPGASAPLDAPVVRVSWFAARAYARWTDKRLPTTAEWERTAAVGYTVADGASDEIMRAELYRWLARPTPAVLPSVDTTRPNFLGVSGLHGLVWEWVDDFNTAMVTGESRADTGLDRNLFCGSGSIGASDATDYPAFVRQALRSSLAAKNTTSSLGFRCARDLGESGVATKD
jgi:sulfatase modifying factor 1